MNHPLPLAVALAVLLVGTTAFPAEGRRLDLRAAPYSAVGDGTADDRPALARVLADAKAGDTVIVPPGRYRIDLTKQVLAVPAGVTLWGQSGKSVFALTCAGEKPEHREFLRLASDVTLEGLFIERAAEFPAVLLPLFGELDKVTLRHCHFFGNAARYPKYCHALQVGNGTLKALLLDEITIEDCTYGLFQANPAKGVVAGVLVERSHFLRNRASDLEFNSPNGAMSDISVRDCHFRDNQSKSPSGGFAVGFAKVAGGRVERCRIENYGSEALHVEDHSTDIHLVGNTIIRGSQLQGNGIIMVLSASQRIEIARNVIDARENTNKVNLILVTAGGKQFENPADVTVKDNVLLEGALTRKWYLQPGSGPEVVGNVEVKGEMNE
jgi:hypothetical protein